MEEKTFSNVVILTNSLDSGMSLSHPLWEFALLIEQIGLKSVQVFTQKIDDIDKKMYCGKGKLEEIAYFLQENKKEKDIKYLLTNFDLSALQKKTISSICGIEVIDRTMVILQIFEKNAKTREAKLQVDIAKLNYLKTHLIDNSASYSQVTSGKGHNKGTGEKQIELSRRQIDGVIVMKKRELESIERERANRRSKRINNPIPKIALVGYTNAGKSTLMNALLEKSLHHSNKNVLAKDALFATLDTSTRLISPYPYPSFLLSDTVGFISDLPNYLLEAFSSTLEEIKTADLIVKVVDVSDSEFKRQLEATDIVLTKLGVDSIPSIILFNKYDCCKKNPGFYLKENELFTSLKEDSNIDEIIEFICKSFAKSWEMKEFVFPYELNFDEFISENLVLENNKKDDGYHLKALINPTLVYKYKHLF